MASGRIFARLIGAFTAVVALAGGLIPVAAEASATLGTIAIAPLTASASAATNVTLMVHLHNASGKQLSAGTVSFSTSPEPLTTNSAITDWMSKKAGGPLPGIGLGSMASPGLAANETVNVSFTFPAAKLATTNTWGVRGIAASFRVGNTTVDFGRTTLVLTVGNAPAAVRLATIVPVTSPASALGLVSKEELTTSTSEIGYLNSVLALADKHSVALAVDPRLTTSIVSLGNAAPASATTWLSALNSRVRDGFWLSYGDSDLTGQIQAGADAPMTPSLSDLPNIPQPTAPDQGLPSDTVTWPGWTPTISDVAWPRANSVATGNIDTLASQNYRRFLLASSNLKSDGAYARVTAESSPVVQVNSGVSSCWSKAEVATDQFSYLAGIACATSYLASLATSSTSSALVVASMSRILPGTAAFASLSSTYAALVNQDWIRPSTLSEVYAAPARSAQLISQRESTSRLARIATRLANQHEVIAFSAVATESDKVINPGQRRLASVLTNGWDTGQAWLVGCATNDSLTAEVLNSVSIVTSSTINMVGGQARIPVVIRNDLESPVTVILHAEPSNARLVVEDNITLTIQERSQSRAYIPVTARVGSGSLDLKVSLTDLFATPIGQVRVIPVRVRADWEAWGLAGIGTVFVALVIAGVIRTVRKRRVRS